MPELWLRKVFPAVVNVNNDVPEKRVKMILSKRELSLLPEDSTDIYKRNVVSRYFIRPTKEVFNHNSYPKRITLSTREKLVHLKVDFVLRYHVPNKHKDPKAYAHQLLFMFYPFRSEE